MTEFKRPQSIAPSRRRFRVAASPFNTVKLDVIVVACFGLLLLFAVGGGRVGLGGQLLILGGYGVAGALWVVWRTRRIAKRSTPRDAGLIADPHSESQNSSSTHYGQE